MTGGRGTGGDGLPPGEDLVWNAAGRMEAFFRRTGVVPGAPPTRYLWTDAFAVCNALALRERTGDERWLQRALDLVDQVHSVLGRHRPDAARTGWLSGLSEEEGRRHPTIGGLRIGKRLPERAPNEPFDARLEWDRDGQYFHYLTKWMHALEQVSAVTGEPRFHEWARELALAAHRGFVHGPRGSPRMVWKASTDLARALVPSMGQHDPLDGFLACLEIESAGSADALASARADFARMVERVDLRTEDPLGLGGLLADAGRLVQLMEPGSVARTDLLATVLDAAGDGLAAYLASEELRRPASARLPFRELGLAIGLAGLAPLDERLRMDPRGRALLERVERLRSATPIGDALRTFWGAAENQRVRSWSDHLDIDEVMLATALVPEGFLILRPRRARISGDSADG